MVSRTYGAVTKLFGVRAIVEAIAVLTAELHI
jgi:hypothetical protein